VAGRLPAQAAPLGQRRHGRDAAARPSCTRGPGSPTRTSRSPRRARPPRSARWTRWVHQVRNDAKAVPEVLREVGSGAIKALGDPGSALRSAQRYGQSLRRVLTPPAAEGSPLLAKRSLTWRFAALDVPSRTCGRPAVGRRLGQRQLSRGAARRLPLYHEAMGVPVRTIPSPSRSRCASRATPRAATRSPRPGCPRRSARSTRGPDRGDPVAGAHRARRAGDQHDRTESRCWPGCPAR